MVRYIVYAVGDQPPTSTRNMHRVEMCVAGLSRARRSKRSGVEALRYVVPVESLDCINDGVILLVVFISLFVMSEG